MSGHQRGAAPLAGLFVVDKVCYNVVEPELVREGGNNMTDRIAKALIRMSLEYGGSAEIDAVSPRMREAQTEAIEALKEAGYADAKGRFLIPK